MKRGARDSQVVNNFFTFATIIIIAIVLTLYSKYVVKDENQKIEVVKLECEKEIYTYVKASNYKLLNKASDALSKGYYKLDGGIVESLSMKSKIKDFMSLDEIDNLYISSIGIKPKEDIKKYINIRYEIIENNKRLNSGSIMTSFQINSKELFRVYTDFAFMYKNAIKNRIDCSIKVLKNHANASRK